MTALLWPIAEFIERPFGMGLGFVLSFLSMFMVLMVPTYHRLSYFLLVPGWLLLVLHVSMATAQLEPPCDALVYRNAKGIEIAKQLKLASVFALVTLTGIPHYFRWLPKLRAKRTNRHVLPQVVPLMLAGLLLLTVAMHLKIMEFIEPDVQGVWDPRLTQHCREITM